jgi:hypothetical protein
MTRLLSSANIKTLLTSNYKNLDYLIIQSPMLKKHSCFRMQIFLPKVPMESIGIVFSIPQFGERKILAMTNEQLLFVSLLVLIALLQSNEFHFNFFHLLHF